MRLTPTRRVPEVRPFPYAALPSWRRTDVARVRQALRHLLPVARSDLLGPPWHELVGGVVTALPGPPQVLSRGTVQQRYEGTVLAPVLRHSTLGVLAVLIDRPLGLALAERALGVRGAGVPRTASTGSLSPADEGALAVLVAQAVTRVFAPAPPPVLRGVSERLEDVLAVLDPREESLLVWPWRLAVGPTAGEVHLVLPTERLVTTTPVVSCEVERLGGLRVALRVEAAREELLACEVASLDRDSILTLDSLAWCEGHLRGAVTLALGDQVLPARIEDDEGLRIMGAAAARGRIDVDGSDERATTAVRTEVLAGLPVEVTVELARGSVTVAEVGAWRVGEVLRFGQRLGESVVVRAGGKPVARGQLVDVEGEVGVQLQEVY